MTSPGPGLAPGERIEIVMVPPWTRWAFAGAGLFLLGGAVYMVVTAWAAPDLAAIARVALTAGALLPLGLAALFLYVGVAVRPTRYVLDADGIRRIGNSPWALRWADVAAAGLRRHEWIQPVGPTSWSPMSLRRRRRSWLLIAPTADRSAAIPALRPVDDVPGFDRGDLVPELMLGSGSPPVERLDAALARVVPDRYVGVSHEGRPVRPPR